MIDCEHESEPLVSMMNDRSPGLQIVWSLRTTWTWSEPALVPRIAGHHEAFLGDDAEAE